MHEYLKFWNVDTAVFLRPVSSRALYLVKDVSDSLERLKVLATSEPRALMVLTGAAGTGKSTILRWLADELPVATHELVILSLATQEVNPGWLSARLAAAMGQLGSNLSIHENLAFIAKRVDQWNETGKKLMVAIDSAHLLSTGEAINDIVALLNVQSLSVSCMTFLLSGELGLMDTLATIPGLLGKIALHMRIYPLNLKETQTYLEMRLRLAGVPNAFETGALQLIYEWSKGIMASIDIFAEHCLIEAFKKNTQRISLEIARSAARHLVQTHSGAPNPKDMKSVSTEDSPPLEAPIDQLSHERNETTLNPDTNTSLKKGDLQAEPAASLKQSRGDEPLSDHTIPPPPSGEEKSPNTKKQSSAEGSASIRLSSLFKSVPSRPKPKGP